MATPIVAFSLKAHFADELEVARLACARNRPKAALPKLPLGSFNGGVFETLKASARNFEIHTCDPDNAQETPKGLPGFVPAGGPAPTSATQSELVMLKFSKFPSHISTGRLAMQYLSLQQPVIETLPPR